MTCVLILRPQPGADATAQRAREMGLEPVVAPLFTIAPLAWDAPDPAACEALMLTSANAVRHAGPELARYRRLRCYCVGEATAAAARAAGFDDVVRGEADAEALLARCAQDGVRRILHLCGRDHIPADHEGLQVDRRAVYAADAVRELPEAGLRALQDRAVALVHSPRAAALFARLAPERERSAVAAISPAAAQAAGEGWLAKAAAPLPTDQALLEVAAKLCKTRPR